MHEIDGSAYDYAMAVEFTDISMLFAEQDLWPSCMPLIFAASVPTHLLVTNHIGPNPVNVIPAAIVRTNSVPMLRLKSFLDPDSQTA